MKLNNPPAKILILGATGMLGHTLLRGLSRLDHLSVHATARSLNGLERWFNPDLLRSIQAPVDAGNFSTVKQLLAELRPDVVINCIGVIKQLAGARDPLQCIEINALFPHRLAQECQRHGARLIHISTDCVFSGNKGMYVESDFPDCDDLYGRTKLLGEVDYPHAVTLRTSIIGHELHSSVSLIDWFLEQEGPVKGFTRAIYSGFPTIELAKIIERHVIPNESLSGIYHVSSEPISKYDLLHIIKKHYNVATTIEPYDDFLCDRSMNSDRFRKLTGYVPPDWNALVSSMHEDFVSNYGK